MSENFHYRLYGNPLGPKLVFLHGLMGYSANWRSIISQLEGRFLCLVFDQRGHGRSFKPIDGYSPKDYAADLYKIVSDLRWNSFALIGHSMGGRNALAFADQYQDLLTHLVIEDIPPEETPGSEDYFQKLFATIPTPFACRADSKNYFEFDFIGPHSPYQGQKTLALFLASNLETLENGSVDWRFSKNAILKTLSAMKNYSLWPILPRLKVPTLWIRGENSKDLPLQSFQRILTLNPLISGVEIQGSGHWVHFDRPQEFTQCLIDFLTY